MGVKIKNLADNKFVVLILLTLLVFMFKFNTINDPYFDDAAFWYVPTSLLISQNNLNPIYRGIGIPEEMQLTEIRKHPWVSQYISDFSHPPLFYEIMAVSYILLGHSQITSHIIILFFVILTLFFTYLIGREVFNSEEGLLASILLFFSPIFFSQSGRIFPEMAITALTLVTFYFVFKERFYLYLLSGTILVLLKEQGVIGIFGILIYLFFKHKKEGMKSLFNKLFRYSIPIFILVYWYIFHYLKTGLFTYYSDTSKYFISAFIENLFFIVKFLLFDQYRIFLTAGIIVFFMTRKNYKVNLKMSSLLLTLTIYVLFIAWVDQGQIFTSNFYIRHVLPIFPIFFLFSSHKLFSLIKNKSIKIVLALIIILLFVSNYHTPTKYNFEENMRYRDIILTQEKALTFLNQYPETSKIWVDLYTYLNFGYPYVGYVDKSLNIDLIPIEYLKFEDANPVFQDNFNSGDLVLETSLYMTLLRGDYQKIRILDLELLEEINVHNDYVKIFRVN